MTGPEHYREAEKLLRTTEHFYNGGQTRSVEGPSERALAKAQVHATLAAAAATIEMALAMQADNGVTVEWIKAVTT